MLLTCTKNLFYSNSSEREYICSSKYKVLLAAYMILQYIIDIKNDCID